MQLTTIGSWQKHLIFLFSLQNTGSVHFHWPYNIFNMIKINLILQQETFQRSKGEMKSSSSVSSFTLNANDLLKRAEENGQIKPILKQSKKNNIFSKSKKYVFLYISKDKSVESIHNFKYFRTNEIRCAVDIHLSVTVSSDSSVSVTPKVHCKKSDNLNSNNGTFQTELEKKKTKHQRTNSDTGPTKPRCDSIWYYKIDYLSHPDFLYSILLKVSNKVVKISLVGWFIYLS